MEVSQPVFTRSASVWPTREAPVHAEPAYAGVSEPTSVETVRSTSMWPAGEVKVMELERPCRPHEIFELLANEPYAVFLDSGMDRERLGRYSFLASRPKLVVRSKGNLIDMVEGQSHRRFTGNPFEELKELLSRYHRPALPGLPPFQGGFLGFFAYDLGRLIEKIPDVKPDDIGTPDMWLGLYTSVLAFDHLYDRAYAFVNRLDVSEAEVQREFERLSRLAQGRRGPTIDTDWMGFDGTSAPSFDGRVISLESNFTRERYCEMVKKAREYIFAGDIFQVNLSQRFEATFEAPFNPWHLYRRLREINPAPFAAYLNCADFMVASSSPERFLRLTGRTVETRPIKGTRPRGRNPEEEKMLRRQLENSEKDRAELLMIVDLERNDIGRVCKYGSVKVPELFTIETYPTVFHLVATVTGELEEGKGFVELLKACFPGGSITGAPKVRAMEIIEELEPVKRGIYTGSIGYIDLSGACDLNIVIRTLVIKGRKAYLQVGGGIVADSDPELEYEETIAKGRAFLKLLGGIQR